MGDTRFERAYERVRSAQDRPQAIRQLDDDTLVAALAAASKHQDAYLANILATEAQNRIGQKASILHHMRDGIYVIDEQGTIVAANPGAAHLLGYEPEDMVGMDIHGLTECAPDEAEDCSRATCPVLHTVQTGEARECDARYRRADGSTALLAITATAFQRDGGPSRAVVVMHDVTERRRAEDAAQRLAAVFESCGDAIVVRTPEGIITDWNPAATRMFGHRREEAVGRHVHFLIDPALRPVERRLGARVLAGDIVRQYRIRGVRKDGSTVEVSATLSPVRGRRGEVVAIAAVLRDVAELQRLERRVAGFAVMAAALAGFALGWFTMAHANVQTPKRQVRGSTRPVSAMGAPTEHALPAAFDVIRATSADGGRAAGQPAA